MFEISKVNNKEHMDIDLVDSNTFSMKFFLNVLLFEIRQCLNIVSNNKLKLK